MHQILVDIEATVFFKDDFFCQGLYFTLKNVPLFLPRYTSQQIDFQNANFSKH